MVKGNLPFRKKFQSIGQKGAIVFIYNLTPGYTDNIIKAVSPVHAQRKRAVLAGISKGKFHFVPIPEHLGTAYDGFHLAGPIQQGLYQFRHLPFLEGKLVFIGKRQIKTPSAVSVMGAADRMLLRGLLQNLHETAFYPAGSLFVYQKANLLSRQCILNQSLLPFTCYDSFIGKPYALHHTLIICALFHPALHSFFLLKKTARSTASVTVFL
jgi:hypothetical protein